MFFSFGCNHLFINVNDFAAGLFPGNAFYLLYAVVTQLVEKGRIGGYGVYGICHRVYVPVVGLDYVVEYLGATALFGYDGRHSHLRGFERRDAERLGDGRHDVDIGILKHFIDLRSFQEACEMESVGYASFAASLIVSSIISPELTVTKRTFFVFFKTFAAASTKYSGPFCTW